MHRAADMLRTRDELELGVFHAALCANLRHVHASRAVVLGESVCSLRCALPDLGDGRGTLRPRLCA